MEKAKVNAYAKINLVLDVLRKREDGFHEVSMVMQAVDLSDVILLEEAKRNWLVTDSKFIPPNMNNLAMRAVTLMQENYPEIPPLQVTLKKRIPIAAGMAGGSTDCAGVILGINKLFKLGLSLTQMEQLAAELGSDIPFCLGGPTALAIGRGEETISLPDCPKLYIVLVKPPFGVSTPKVYGNLKIDQVTEHPSVVQCIRGLKQHNKGLIMDALGNVLEESTFSLQPEVKQLKEDMIRTGCKNVLMSGSGPTVFAVFSEKDEAKNYFFKLRKKYPSAILTKTVNRKMLKERVRLYDE